VTATNELSLELEDNELVSSHRNIRMCENRRLSSVTLVVTAWMMSVSALSVSVLTVLVSDGAAASWLERRWARREFSSVVADKQPEIIAARQWLPQAWMHEWSCITYSTLLAELATLRMRLWSCDQIRFTANTSECCDHLVRETGVLFNN